MKNDGTHNGIEFIGANGKKYNNWIPAIRLEYAGIFFLKFFFFLSYF
jgi:hypothetical protein